MHSETLRHLKFTIVLLSAVCCRCGGGSTPTSPMPSPTTSSQSWADEFDGSANTLPDPSKWTYDLGNNNGWGNRELETYTNSIQNVRVDGAGHLVIHVDRNGSTYTSARIQWSQQTITFFVDGIAYRTVTPSSLPPGASWVFDNPFFLILNVAVGGNFPGSPDDTTQFPQEMIVDYVRVSGGAV